MTFLRLNFLQKRLEIKKHQLFQLYLAFAKVSIPVLGTDIVQTSELGYARGVLHLVLCLFCFYFGFIKKPKQSEK